MATFLFVFCALFVIASTSSNEKRKEVLSRMKNYELLHFNLDHFASDDQIEFDLFNQHYKIQLFANQNMIPSQVNPIAGHPQSDNSSKWFSSRTESCHYQGYITEPKTSRSHISYRDVALSLCPNRGIRGSIRINGDQIWIKPSAYYLDEDDHRTKYHQLTDPHLVYKSSDFDRTGLLSPRSIQDNDHAFSRSHSSASSASRKLLASKTCELYVLADHSQVEEFKDDHDDDWYQELLGMALDYINNVDADYTDLGKVGDIDIVLVRLEVVESWSGDYRSLRPDDYDRSEVNCYDYKSDKFSDWLSDENRNKYDVHQIWTNYDCERASGWGSVGCVCDSSRCNSLVATISRNGDEGDINTVAHEMEDGIMGDLRHGWSKCSIEAFEEHYDDTSSLSCLRDGPRSFSSNYGGGGGGYDGGNDNNNNDDNNNNGGGSSGGDTQIFSDRMDDLNGWTVTTSKSVSISSSKCTSSSCVLIKGYDDTDNSITRRVSNDYSSYSLKFDVILDNMETNNACEVSVKFDRGRWKTVKSYKGDCCTSTETYKAQTAEFNAPSASRLHIRLSTDGDSSSGGDRCYFDNVYLFGSGSGSGGRFELDPCLASNPYGNRLCFYQGKEEDPFVFDLSTGDGCVD
eukprot:87988_1